MQYLPIQSLPNLFSTIAIYFLQILTYKEVLQNRFRNEYKPFRDDTLNQLEQTNTLEWRFDFGHTSPNWKEIISLGFVGLKNRAV